MSFSIFLFLLNFVLIICIKDGFFTFETNEKNQIITNISIGTPPQNFRILLDTSTIYLMIFPYDTKSKMNIKNKFNYTASSTFNNIKNFEINNEYLENQITPITVNDTITIADMTLNFSFLLIDDSNEFPDFDEIDGILGIGFKYEELNYNMELFSLLQQLYVKNLISKKVYYINFYDYNKGIVQFGKKNKELLKHNIGTCIPPNDGIKNMLIGKWQCVIKRIFIGKYMKNFTIYEREENNIDFITFDTGINFITVPENFFEFIIKKITKYINDTCFYETLKGKKIYKRIKCKKYFKNIFYNNDIYFTIGNHIMILPYQSIYSDIDNYTYFNMITYENNTNEFELGQILLKNFIIEFDKSTETISFFSKNYIIDTKKNKLNVLKTFSIFFIFFVMITFIIYKLLIKFVIINDFKIKDFEEEKKLIKKSFNKIDNKLIPSNETSFNHSITSLNDLNKLIMEEEYEIEK